jgi:23S rRNA pseudouridine2605 synthase
MRINRYIAFATGMSRRAADQAILEDRVRLNNVVPQPGVDVGDQDSVSLDGAVLTLPEKFHTIVLNKPVGYVVSRDGQGSKTIYELLPPELHNLKPIGRLDKDSSGLLLLTDNGTLAQELTHPSRQKKKVYIVRLNKSLSEGAATSIVAGVQLDDGVSRLELKGHDTSWVVTMYEGRNRQVRRTFEYFNYMVVALHRVRFGDYVLSSKQGSGEYKEIY